MGNPESGGSGAEEILLMHVRVQTELGLHLFKNGGDGLNLIVYEVAFGELLAAVGKLLFAEVIDLFEGGAFEFHFAAEFADDGVNCFFFTAGVENDESFVFTLHGLW